MPTRAILAAILVASCWGGNFTATKIAMQDFPPFMALLVRFIGVAVVLAPFALRQARPQLRDMMVISLLLIVLQFAFIFSAMDRGLTITSVIIATQLGVPFACIVAAIVFKDYLGPWRSGGLMIAFFGVMIVAGTPNASEHWDAFALAVLGSLAWALSNVYLKCVKPTPPVVQLLFWPALFSILPLFLLSYIGESHQWAILHEAKVSSWVGIAYSLIFSSIIGYGIWNRLMTTYPMSSVVPYSLLVPVVGISAGAIAFGEPITWQIILGASLTIIGVGVITLRRPALAELEP